MAEMIWWCVPYHELRTMSEPCVAGSNHDRPHECRWLVDPATVDYEAARDAMVKAHPPFKPPYWGIDVLARVAVDAALGVGSQIEGSE